ncbi:MAG: GHKL domain-containing protein [Epsilonproteobacteria bacterium]|nr:GHKL domain-containing protein [Campylobacterota bacterium]
MKTNAHRRLGVLALCCCALFITSWIELFLQRKQTIIGVGVSKTFLFLLINIHVVVMIILLYLIVRQSIKLFLERQKKVPGSVFKRNLLFAFTFFSVIPSFFVFFTAGKFITTSIDDWFKARISSGLDTTLFLHEQYTQDIRKKIQADAHLLSQQHIIASTEEQNTRCTHYHWHDNASKQKALEREARVWRALRTTNDRSIKNLRQVFLTKLTQAEANKQPFDFYGSLYHIVKNNNQTLMLVHRYPDNVCHSLIEIENAINDYTQLKSIRNSIYANYLCTFILVTLLILFLSIWCAFYLAKGISKPLKELLDATDKVSKGSWDVQVSPNLHSDLQSLALGFNKMTKALASAHTQLELRNKEMLAILENLKAAVIFINQFGRVITFNQAADTLAQSHLRIRLGKNKKVVFNQKTETERKIFYDCIRKLFTSGKQQLTQKISLLSNNETKTFVVHLALISITPTFNPNDQGMLMVLEDLTDIVKLNTIKTWQDAAKQMAHEIKNPLTPIQLSTQRLQRKYSSILKHDHIFIHSTETILSQVKILKDLTAHFFRFSSMPAIVIESTNLHTLIQEIMYLYEMSYPEIYFFKTLEGQALLNTDKKKLKRVLINLVDNSINAIKRYGSNSSHRHVITITTKTHAEKKQLEIILTDNGPGIGPQLKDKLFLPYVSSEKKNMGLGLAIVKDTISQLGGSIYLLPTTHGASFQILLPM